MNNCEDCTQSISERKEHFNWTEGGNVFGCPGAVFILKLILLPQEGLPRWGVDHGLRWFHGNLVLILTGQIKSRACDCAVEEKGRSGGFRE